MKPDPPRVCPPLPLTTQHHRRPPRSAATGPVPATSCSTPTPLCSSKPQSPPIFSSLLQRKEPPFDRLQAPGIACPHQNRPEHHRLPLLLVTAASMHAFLPHLGCSAQLTAPSSSRAAGPRRGRASPPESRRCKGTHRPKPHVATSPPPRAFGETPSSSPCPAGCPCLCGARHEV
jgi:hypothetical protein